MPTLEASNLSNDVDGNNETDIISNLKNMGLENSNLTKINSAASSNISIKLDSTKINENSSLNQVENRLKKERQNAIKIGRKKKTAISEISKDKKSKCGTSFPNKPTYHNKHLKHPLSKRKFVPVASHLTNTSAKVVLFERNVEIKDLESKVKYLQNKIKDLENENKTLQGVQSRQGRELKKFKEGVADIPSLLRSHREEIKVYESALSSIRRELRDCQKDIKVKNEILLKKESHIDKLNVTMKRYEKNIQDLANELKEFKITKKDLEEDNKILLGINENLKSENENLQKKIKCMVQQMENSEENFMREKNLNKRHKYDLAVLQKKYEDIQLKISSQEDTSQSDKLDNCNPEEEDICEKSAEILSEDNVKIEDNKCSNLPEEETKEKSPEKELCADKTKDALIHTLKRYQDLCSTKRSKFSTKACGIGASNLKLLPPLKQPCRKHSQNMHPDFVKKESFSASADKSAKNGNMQWQSEELEKYFHNKLKTNETVSVVENKILITKDIVKMDKNSNFRAIQKPNASQSHLQLSTFDNW